jgi:hypothetical protein
MNIYYEPDKFGLAIVGELEYGGGFDYDTFVVFKSVVDGDFDRKENP